MAVSTELYGPPLGSAASSLTPPATIDGTGLTTSVPLLIKNAKNLSGLELQQTGTAATGFILRDAAGLQRGAFGLNNAAGDWSASSAAGEAVLVGPSTAGKRLVLQGAGGAAGGVLILSASGTAFLTVDGTVGAQMAFGSNTLTINGTNATFVPPVAIVNSNSLATIALQVAGDPDTGMGPIGGANTFSAVCGGVEVSRWDAAGGMTMLATALATGATTGFPILRTMAGTPTGAVADGAFVIDTTASKLWARVGGAWKAVAIA